MSLQPHPVQLSVFWFSTLWFLTFNILHFLFIIILIVHDTIISSPLLVDVTLSQTWLMMNVVLDPATPPHIGVDAVRARTASPETSLHDLVFSSGTVTSIQDNIHVWQPQNSCHIK